MLRLDAARTFKLLCITQLPVNNRANSRDDVRVSLDSAKTLVPLPAVV